jgi:hypothetical protein
MTGKMGTDPIFLTPRIGCHDDTARSAPESGTDPIFLILI